MEVIYPVKRNVARGLILPAMSSWWGGKIVEGDVELHVASSEWYSHGHDWDAGSDGIVLHVVWCYDTYRQARLRNGRTVPTVVLGECFGSIIHYLSYRHRMLEIALHRCSSSYRVPVLRLATLMGEVRFFAKASQFRDRLVNSEPARLLVKQICRALGYAQDCLPFKKLASGLPVEVMGGHMGSAEREALLFDFAGLLPSQRPRKHMVACGDYEVRKLKAIRRATGNWRLLSDTEWCFFRVRPDNFTPCRISALSELLSRYDEFGLLDKILGLLRQMPGGTERSWLEGGLIVNGVGYWGITLTLGYKNPLIQPYRAKKKLVR